MKKKIVVKSWPARIAAARKRGAFTDKDRDDAGRWPTCACGELDADIPFDGPWGPIDHVLNDLGISFDCAVLGDQFARAAELITAITKRAAEVLKEQSK